MRKRRRSPPDEGLKEPVKKFEDTFSAEEVVLKTFFANETAELTDDQIRYLHEQAEARRRAWAEHAKDRK